MHTETSSRIASFCAANCTYYALKQETMDKGNLLGRLRIHYEVLKNFIHFMHGQYSIITASINARYVQMGVQIRIIRDVSGLCTKL